MKLRTLTVFLVARALFGASFGLLLLASRQTQWGDAFARFGNYVLADGVMALVVAAGFLLLSPSTDPRWHRWLAPALVACDAFIRLGAGVAIRGWPGIPYFPVTSVIYLSTIGVLTAWISLVELGVLAAVERRQHWHIDGPISPRIALIAAGAVPMLLLGLKLVIAPPSSAGGLRLLFAGYMLATSCGLAIAAVRAEGDARRRSLRPALFVMSNVRRQAAAIR